MKKFQDTLKTVYDPNSSGTTQLSAGGRTLGAILKWWTEHFDSLLSRPSTMFDNAINRLPQLETNGLLDEFPTITETTKAIQHLTSDKAPGSVTKPAVIYKAGGQPMAAKLTELFLCMWRKEVNPTRIQKYIHNPHIRVEKNVQVCASHRGSKNTGDNPTESPKWTKRVCEAERKRKERKARAKGSSAKSSFPKLTCSICYGQFRAKTTPTHMNSNTSYLTQDLDGHSQFWETNHQFDFSEFSRQLAYPFKWRVILRYASDFCHPI